MSDLPESVLEEYGPKLVDPTLRLSDGTSVYGGGSTLPGSTELILWLDKRNGMTLPDAMWFFSDPEKNRKITYTNIAGDEKIFEGYTGIRMIRMDADGKISLKLVRET